MVSVSWAAPVVALHLVSGAGHGFSTWHHSATERVTVTAEPPPLGENAALKSIGRPVSRLDAVQKVTGRARYTFDVQLSGMLWGRLVVSPWPHARVKSIDTSEAERYPGVRAVHVLEAWSFTLFGAPRARIAAP